MNKTVKLVNEWGNFEAKHPNANIDDFCRHYLASHQKQKVKGPLTGGVVPPTSEGLLLKMIGRINKMNMSYANSALEETGLNQVEEFGMLLTIQQEGSPRKTDIIYANLFELSSGTDMLNRLKKRNLVKEYDDQDDKRSKRVELTPAGLKAIELCMMRMRKVASMMTKELSEDDKQLCIQLLKNIEIKFSKVWQQHKGKPFDEVYENVMGG
ncbi:MAG TPA: MarR family winged helix-turn-helix transcriptional regulator [Mucilaginibacter sp.]|nr:MarR family winged helix-turn-helix transcriptional regulator [Mucilaginibacter sp.]